MMADEGQVEAVVDVPVGLESLQDQLSKAKYRVEVAQEYLETAEAMVRTIEQYLENIIKERNAKNR